MTIRAKCPKCKKSLVASDAAAGKLVRCKSCNSAVRIRADNGSESDLDFGALAAIERSGKTVRSHAPPPSKTEPNKSENVNPTSIRVFAVLLTLPFLFVAVLLLFQPLIPDVKAENRLSLITRIGVALLIAIPPGIIATLLWYFSIPLAKRNAALKKRWEEEASAYSYRQKEIRVIGGINCCLGVLLAGCSLLVGIGSVFGFLPLNDTKPPEIGPTLLAMLWGGAMFIYGLGLRRFESWAWILAVLNSVLMLFLFPIGTLLGGYVLWVLISSKDDFG